MIVFFRQGCALLLLSTFVCWCEGLSPTPHLQPPPPLLPPGSGASQLTHLENSLGNSHDNSHNNFQFSFHSKNSETGRNGGGYPSNGRDPGDSESGWWEGVEEVDLTQSHRESQFYLIPLQQQPQSDDSYPNCEGSFEDSCDFLLPPPQLFLPPPPIPPFLPGLVNLAESQRSPAADGKAECHLCHSECQLCHWAMHGNASSTFLHGDLGE